MRTRLYRNVPTVPFTLFGSQTRYRDASVVVIPVPFDSTASNQAGARNGPFAIIKESLDTEPYDGEYDVDCAKGLHTTPFLEIADDAEMMCARLYALVCRVMQARKFPLVIGGDHSIAPGAIAAVLKSYPQLSVLHFDAHNDLRDTYRQNKFSHASPMRRVSEDHGIPIVQVGIRSSAKNLEAYIKTHRIHVVSASALRNQSVRNLAIAGIAEHLTQTVYVSFDVDCYDPSIMPDTGTPEPSGLIFDDVRQVLRAALSGRKLVGADVVEFSPGDYHHNAPANLAVRTIGSILASRQFELSSNCG